MALLGNLLGGLGGVLFGGSRGNQGARTSDALEALVQMLGQQATTRGTTRAGFDRSQLPFLQEALGMSDEAAGRLRTELSQLSDERRQQLQDSYRRQLEAIRGFGNQELSNINTRYDARRGGVNQSLVNRGLYNSTVAQGMQALNERERNRALGEARSRQMQMYGNVLGSQAAGLDRAAAQRQGLLSGVAQSQYDLRAALPRAITGSERRTTNQRRREGLIGLF